MSTDDIIARTRALDNECKILRSETLNLQSECKVNEERIKVGRPRRLSPPPLITPRPPLPPVELRTPCCCPGWLLRRGPSALVGRERMLRTLVGWHTPTCAEHLVPLPPYVRA